MPELRLPRRLETVSAVCDHSEALVRDAGWSEADVLRVALVLGEAVGNAVEHGEGEVSVSFELGADRLTVCVGDEGRGPSPERVAQAALPDDPLATSGRGLFILQRLADEVRVDEDGGLCLTIRAQS